MVFKSRQIGLSMAAAMAGFGAFLPVRETLNDYSIRNKARQLKRRRKAKRIVRNRSRQRAYFKMIADRKANPLVKMTNWQLHQYEKAVRAADKHNRTRKAGEAKMAKPDAQAFLKLERRPARIQDHG